ncbi:hypothetical protein JX266_003248 [Neoarthrinium moseri]|nr:hypothetical protein JX266_003248 [Neoarthrinium moseri]
MSLVSFFAHALGAFQQSKTSFRVLCTLPLSKPGALAPRPPGGDPLRTLLVLDSSFNPPTLAHQRMALSAMPTEPGPGSHRLLLLLAINNADKAPQSAAFPERLAMMYLFALELLRIRRVPGVELGDKEAEAVDIAVTTEPYFHSKSGAVAASDFYRGSGDGGGEAAPEQVYLTGFDTLIRVFDPKYYPDNSMRRALDPFLTRSRLRVTMRTDADWGDAVAQRAYLESLRGGRLDEVGGRAEWADRVDMVEGRREGEAEAVISSTKVRQAVRGRDWAGLRELVSDGVAEWIETEGLYNEDPGRSMSELLSKP